jgi:hypothetical protein
MQRYVLKQQPALHISVPVLCGWQLCTACLAMDCCNMLSPSSNARVTQAPATIQNQMLLAAKHICLDLTQLLDALQNSCANRAILCCGRRAVLLPHQHRWHSPSKVRCWLASKHVCSDGTQLLQAWDAVGVLCLEGDCLWCCGVDGDGQGVEAGAQDGLDWHCPTPAGQMGGNHAHTRLRVILHCIHGTQAWAWEMFDWHCPIPAGQMINNTMQTQA